MAIVFDAVSSGTAESDSLTFSHTVGVAGTNRIIIVGVAYGPTLTVNSVKYATIDLTKIRTDTNTGDHRHDLWYLVAPATGANNVVVSGL